MVVIGSILVIVFVASYQIALVLASSGDNFYLYRQCVARCKGVNCTQDGSFKEHGYKLLDWSSKALCWGCQDECRYHCMWKTVDFLEKDGHYLPKFYGKWPFIRLYGVQEPASAFASFLNLACYVYMHYEMATQFSAKDTPLLRFWHGFTLVCENGWMWSLIFHTRDTEFTEFMDYACALSMVMAVLAAGVVRVCYGRTSSIPRVLLALMLWYYVSHVRYLYYGRIDYGYNMTVNVVCGILGGVLWALWAGVQLARRRGRHHTRLLVFVTWLAAALSLELLDFPPVAGWDAHALWHLATAPLPLVFYRFIIEDLSYLKTEDTTKGDLKMS